MTTRTIFITEFDMQRLRRLLSQIDVHQHPDRRNLLELQRELDRATIVAPAEIPPTVVTMNSTVRFQDTQSGDEMVLTVVFPDDADTAAGKVSVVAPVGTALLGYKVGDRIEWTAPAGRRRMHIKEMVYQPEAAGHFNV